MMLMFALALATAGAAAPATADEAWLQCARTAAEAKLDRGVSASWPKQAALPDDRLLMVELGARPSEEAMDAMHYMLRGAPERNAVYIVRSGGIGDFRVIYGPIPLAGQCLRAQPSV